MTGQILSAVKGAQSWPVQYPALWEPDISPVTALNSRATDDLNRSK